MSIGSLPHVRAVLFMGKLTRHLRRSQWNIGVCSNSPERNAPHCGVGPCLAGAFWLASPKTIRGTSASIWQDPFGAIGASGGFSNYSEPAEVAKLGDIDEAFFAFFMNRRLFEAVASAHVYANEYLIWSSTADQLYADQPNTVPKTPWKFTSTELSDEWVRVMPRDGTGTIYFSSLTPRRLWAAPRLEQAD